MSGKPASGVLDSQSIYDTIFMLIHLVTRGAGQNQSRVITPSLFPQEGVSRPADHGHVGPALAVASLPGVGRGRRITRPDQLAVRPGNRAIALSVDRVGATDSGRRLGHPMGSCTGQESAHGNQLLRMRRPYGDFAAAVGLGKEKIAQIERLRYTTLVRRSMMCGPSMPSGTW